MLLETPYLVVCAYRDWAKSHELFPELNKVAVQLMNNLCVAILHAFAG
jgi:hypothetical protein